MNRRNFLKSLATACGAAVVAPAVLLKGKSETLYPNHKGIKLWPIQQELLKIQNEATRELVEKFEAAFWNTKFKRPVPYGIRGDRSKFFYFQGVPIIYEPELST